MNCGNQGLAVVTGKRLKPLTKGSAKPVEEIEIAAGRVAFTHVAITAVFEEQAAPEFKGSSRPTGCMASLVEALIGETSQSSKASLCTKRVTVDEMGKRTALFPGEFHGNGVEYSGANLVDPVRW